MKWCLIVGKVMEPIALTRIKHKYVWIIKFKIHCDSCVCKNQIIYKTTYTITSV